MLAFLLAGSASPIAAQHSLDISGRTIRIAGTDTVPVPGVPVTLHRVSRTVQGAVDSVMAGPDGRYRFRRPGDTSAVYLVSARYAGIEYFGEPVRPPGATGLLIVVSDTSSSAPVRLAGRHVIVRPPGPTGTRAVLDLFSIRNDGPDTRVGRDSLSPTWAIALPPGVSTPEVSEGDFSPTAVEFRGDSVLVLAPLAPGGKNLMVSYELPVGVDRRAWSAAADSFDMLVEEPGVEVRGAGLSEVAPVELMGDTLRRWTAVPPTGGDGEVVFPGGSQALSKSLYWLVGGAALLLLLGAAQVFRRIQRPAATRALVVTEDVIGQIAALDARYQGRQAEVPADEWSAYGRDRARLMAAALARSRPRS